MEKLHLDPLAVAVLVGVGLYLLIIALLPKDFLAENTTKYTRKHLKGLEKKSAYLNEADEGGESQESSGVLARAFYSLPIYPLVHPYIIKSGMARSVDLLFGICLATFLVLLLLLTGKGLASFPLAFAVSVFAGFGIGYVVVKGKIKRRSEKFMVQFPDALDAVVRSVRSGFPLNAAINMVHESMDAPISEEFKTVSNEVLYGSTLVDALDRLAVRVDLPDVRFFTVVLSLQQEVGGNLAETLSNLSALIRKRRMMRLKISALTSEGKATGWVLGALPFFVGGAVSFMSPDYLEPLFTTESGHHVVIAALTSIAIGVGIVRKMNNLEI